MLGIVLNERNEQFCDNRQWQTESKSLSWCLKWYANWWIVTKTRPHSVLTLCVYVKVARTSGNICSSNLSVLFTQWWGKRKIIEKRQVCVEEGFHFWETWLIWFSHTASSVLRGEVWLFAVAVYFYSRWLERKICLDITSAQLVIVGW
jgi:hypothetical protein